MKAFELTIPPGKPFELAERTDVDKSEIELAATSSEMSRQVAETIKEYLAAGVELLDGELSHLKPYAPLHLTDPGKTLVLCCDDGIVVRYDPFVDKQEVFAAQMSKNLEDITPVISEQVIHCFKDKDAAVKSKRVGPTIILSKQSPGSASAEDFLRIQVSFKALVRPPAKELPAPPAKPYSTLSVQNSLELQLHGQSVPENSGEESQRFVVRVPIRLPVGWQAIEVFPYPDERYWHPEYAREWASKDILARVVSKQFAELQWQNLDPNSTARRRYGELIQEYQTLLDCDPGREEILQQFLKINPHMLCPTFTKVWPKLEIGPYQTDFVFRTATKDYLLGELERSNLPLFTRAGQPSSQLTHAQSQILDWKRYIEDNLSSVQRELGLSGISSNPEGIVVMGRTGTLSPENVRFLTTLTNQNPKLRVLTYDDVLLNAKAVVENLLGPLWFESGGTEVYYLPG